MHWILSNRADHRARELADRHYSRQKVGSQQFVPPGRCVVLYAENDMGRAFWVTSWPMAKYVKHRWAGAWVCSAFRNERAGIAHVLIRQAVAATMAIFGEPPELGIITFVDRNKVTPTMVRGIPVFGWTYMKAGFVVCGETKGGLLALQLIPEAMPVPSPPLYYQPCLFGGHR